MKGKASLKVRTVERKKSVLYIVEITAIEWTKKENADSKRNLLDGQNYESMNMMLRNVIEEKCED